MDLTTEGKEMIELIRNYQRAYPNGAKMLEIEILDQVYSMLERD